MLLRAKPLVTSLWTAWSAALRDENDPVATVVSGIGKDPFSRAADGNPQGTAKVPEEAPRVRVQTRTWADIPNAGPCAATLTLFLPVGSTLQIDPQPRSAMPRSQPFRTHAFHTKAFVHVLPRSRFEPTCRPGADRNPSRRAEPGRDETGSAGRSCFQGPGESEAGTRRRSRGADLVAGFRGFCRCYIDQDARADPAREDRAQRAGDRP